ncbi:MAG: hypothetical protein MUO50_08835 [Longimicrobiales bacterium]|nr:hypothetical protein [Longimicrobiales bacterium]
MRRVGIWVLEIGAYLLTGPVLFLLLLGTAMVPTEGLGSYRTFASDCPRDVCCFTAPAPLVNWLLGFLVAFALLAAALGLIGVAVWAPIRRNGGQGLSRTWIQALRAAFCGGAAIITLWTLGVHIVEWKWYADQLVGSQYGSQVELCPVVSAFRHIDQAFFLVMAAAAVVGTIVYTRRAYLEHHRNHKS